MVEQERQVGTNDVHLDRLGARQDRRQDFGW